MENGECDNCGAVSGTLSEADAESFPYNRLGYQQGSLRICPQCKECYEGRQKATTDILSSTLPKRLIVAGPGTGKSHMFGKLLTSLTGNPSALVFTFIKNLVDDLKRDLGGIENDHIKVNTLHGFCKEVLHNTRVSNDLTTDFEYFPSIPLLIHNDAQLLGLTFGKDDFRRDLVNLNEASEALQFYLHQAAYYNAVGYNDSVYRVFNFYRADKLNVPTYGIVIVDEYQDFNLLEATLIEYLTARNNVVIAGDDDQALYGFRDASNKYIRDLWYGEDFENFPLPYCGRCPPVLVDATNEFIKAIQQYGLLRDRIPRDFRCYWPNKHAEDKAFPRILVANCSTQKALCQFVERRILDITAAEGLDGTEKDTQFLIIGPESKYHLKKVNEHLAEALDSNVFEIDSRLEKEENPLVVEQGYSIISEGKNLNLGWRIVLKCAVLPNDADIVKSAYKTGAALVDLLPADYVALHKQALEQHSKVEDSQPADEATKRIRIKLATFCGSKGLSAMHTIIVGLNDYDFPADPKHLTDDEACRFIVALTRARRSCCLVHNGEFFRKLLKLVHRPSRYLQFLPARTKEERKYKTKSNRLVEV